MPDSQSPPPDAQSPPVSGSNTETTQTTDAPPADPGASGPIVFTPLPPAPPPVFRPVGPTLPPAPTNFVFRPLPPPLIFRPAPPQLTAPVTPHPPLTLPASSAPALLPDILDDRDHVFDYTAEAPSPLPSSVDLRSLCPPVYNQTPLESCTAHAISTAIEFERRKQNLTPELSPSRLFIWYNERANENRVFVNQGCSLRDGIKSVVDLGVCPEELWPYDPAKYQIKPPDACYQAALQDKVIGYQSIPQDGKLDQFKGCLASGYPFLFGFAVYTAAIGAAATTHMLELPAATDVLRGSHAVLAVGYSDEAQAFLIRNSWGNGWGDAGYFFMRYGYITDTNLSSAFWTIRLSEPPDSAKAP